MSQDIEQSPLEYARAHGLAIDHTSLDPLQDLERECKSPVLEDDSSLPQLPPAQDLFPVERLHVSKDAIKFLAEALKVPPAQYSFPDPHRDRALKVEQPLLRTDHELDVQDFTKQAVPDLENEALPLEPVDVEADEGLEWPSWCQDLPDRIMSRIESEKLVIPRAAIAYLQNAITPPSPDTLHYREVVDHVENIPEPLTPPLLPISPDFKPYEPSSDVGHMELASENTSVIREELEELDRTLLGSLDYRSDSFGETLNDKTLGYLDAIKEIADYDPLGEDVNTPQAVKRIRRAEELKVEGPLTPPITGPLPWQKNDTSFSEAMSEIAPGLGQPIPRPSKDQTSSDSLEKFFDETLKPIAEQANRKIEQEQLQEVDIVCRVPVPQMDFTPPLAPWDPQNRSSETLMCDVEKDMATYGAWSLPQDAERALQWAPFPSKLAKVSFQRIEDDGSLHQWITPPSEDVFLRLSERNNRPKLVGDTSDDDEEIEPADFSEPAAFSALVRKRKLDLQSSYQSDLKPSSKDAQKSARPRLEESPLNMSTFESFNKFMSSRGFKTERVKTTPAEELTTSACHHSPNQQAFPLRRAMKTDERASHLPCRTIPLPSIPQNPEPSQIIVSSTVINQRSLMRQVRASVPNVTFIERDFKTSIQPLLDSNGSSGLVAGQEADLLISPGVSLLLTSLQKLNQRTLPGQESSTTTIRARLSMLAPRYTTLVVLASQNQPADTPPVPLSPSDSATLSSFTAYARSSEFTALETDVQILYIAGGERELARWVAALIVKHSTSGPAFKLLEEETSWEIWLRTAGLNAYAAQAILGEVKAPEGVQGGLEFGLAKLVCMREQERVDRFAPLLGGEALLRRVSRALDAAWGG